LKELPLLLHVDMPMSLYSPLIHMGWLSSTILSILFPEKLSASGVHALALM